jgi:uncharacterized 2Fe-2S/4Fe-4S cluster protein (DUF4445 family)
MPKTQTQRGRKTHNITFLPFNLKLKVPEGTLILDASQQANLSVQATCGGKGTCGECAVQIVSGTSSIRSSAGLPQHLLSQGYTLACQTEIKENLTVKMPRYEEISFKPPVKADYFEDQKNRISGIYEICPPITKIDLKLSPPTLDDNYSDLTRLEQELKKQCNFSRVNCEYSVLKKLAWAIRQEKGNISLVILDSGDKKTIVDVFPESQKNKLYGISCDLGTSTVVLYLVDLEDGSIFHAASSYNQQITCGEDIISRINYAKNSARLLDLQRLIIDTINRLIEGAVQSCGIDGSQVYFGTITGNTTMIHLLLNLDPRYIREEPYVPTANQVPVVLSKIGS